MEHQEDASDRKNDEEETRDSAQAEGVGEFEAVGFDLCREDVEEEVIVDQQGPLQIRIRYPGPEDGVPKCRICNALNNSFLHAFKIYHKSAENNGKKDNLSMKVRWYPPCKRQMDDGTLPW